MKLEIKHLAGYLPYGLKCQYTGVINGSELSKHKKEFEKENEPWTPWEHYEPIDAVEGLKQGLLKEIHVFKNWWNCKIGIKHLGLKSFYSGCGFKPILRPLSDLTKEIEVNGEKFVPLEKLFGTSVIMAGFLPCINTFNDNFELSVSKGTKTLYATLPQYEKLFEWHFDNYGLIEKGLAISIHDLSK